MGKTTIDINNKTILVTGSMGFLGANFVIRILTILTSGIVVSLDNMNDYYEVSLNEWQLKKVNTVTAKSPFKHVFIRGNIGDKALVDQLFSNHKFDIVVNLAAQAGVRYSIDYPDVYIESNIIGFYNLLEACLHNPIEHLVYASSSSVYGGNKKVPFSTDDKVDNPVSFYVATKKSNELLVHAYSNSITSRPQVYASLRFTVPQVVQICSIIAPLRGLLLARRFRNSIHIAYSRKENGVVEFQSLNFPKRAQFYVNGIPEEKVGDWVDHIRGAVKMLLKKYPLRYGIRITSRALAFGSLRAFRQEMFLSHLPTC